MTQTTRINRKTEKRVSIPLETISEFETSRKIYLIAVAAMETAKSQYEAWDVDHNVTREMIREWNTNDTEPTDRVALRDGMLDFNLTKNSARYALLDAAEKITELIAAKYHMPMVDLPVLFNHVRRNPFSAPTQKFMNVLLRLDLSK
jgi:hypothetical protein